MRNYREYYASKSKNDYQEVYEQAIKDINDILNDKDTSPQEIIKRIAALMSQINIFEAKLNKKEQEEARQHKVYKKFQEKRLAMIRHGINLNNKLETQKSDSSSIQGEDRGPSQRK